MLNKRKRSPPATGAGFVRRSLVPGHDESLLCLQVDRAVLQVNDEVTLEHEEKLIIGVMLVPVILSLHHTQTNHGIVHCAQRLVIPLVSARFDERGNVHHGEVRELDVQVCSVGVCGRVAHERFFKGGANHGA